MGDRGQRPLRAPVGLPDVHLRASPFSRLAVTHALAVAGDALVTLALAGSLFFDISPTAARGKVALSLVLTLAPFAVVAPFLGPAIDKVAGGRRFVLLGAAAGRAVTAVWAATVLDGLLLFPAAFVLLVLSKTHAVAKSSLVPTVVEDKDQLVRANSRLSLIGALVGIVAGIPGAIVLRLAGGEWAMRLAGVLFAATAVSSFRIVPAGGAAAGAGALARPEPADAGAAAGARGAREPLDHPGILLAEAATGALRASVGFLTFLVAFSLRRDGAPAWVFGMVLAASMLGGLAGAAVAPALRRRVVEERLLAGSLALVVVAAGVATRLGGRPAATLVAAALGVAASTGKLAFDSLVQRDAAGAAHGRWFARCETVFQLAWVVGALVPVVFPVPPRVGYLLLAAGAATAAVVYLMGLRARGSPAP